jgi:hypothetical protein
MPSRKKQPDSRVKPFPLRLDPALRAKLQGLADAELRTLTNYIQLVLEEHADQTSVPKPEPTPSKKN